jgi:hypothetical protein
VEDPPIKTFVVVGLVFDMDDEECLLPLEFGFDDDVGFEGFAFSSSASLESV